MVANSADPVRQKQISAAISESDLDAIVCGGPTDVLMLTGYWPVMGTSVAIFRADGVVVVIVPKDEMELAEQTTAAELISYEPAGLDTLETPMELLRHPLKKAFRKLGLDTAAIGLQLRESEQPVSYAVTMHFRNSFTQFLAELFPMCVQHGCDQLLEELKAAKTSKEIELMDSAAKVAAAAFGDASMYIHAGMREAEVAADFQAAFERARQAESLERSFGFFFCMSGPNSATAAAAYARTRQRVIKEGDLVMIHANTCADGFWTDITRTYTAGAPIERHREIRYAIDEARSAGLAAIRPGATGSQVDRAVRNVMEARGFGKEFKHAAGHGVGFAAANPNGRPRIHPLSSDVLQEGMTFNLEPAAYFDGYGGMRHCDVVAVTEDGARVITNF